MKRLRFFMLGLLTLFLAPTTVTAQDILSSADYLRRPAYELFGDPSAFFFLHSYTDLTYWDYEKDYSLPLQFHSAQSDASQFSNYFTALFIGTEVSPTLSVLTQLHFHLNPIPGQVGPTVVLPQAKLTWKPLETENVRLHFGRFYSPFGITNDDVQTPINRFVSQPYTGFTAIPFHWFDTGVLLDLASPSTNRVGANLAVAFTNGPQRIVPDVPLTPTGDINFQGINDNILIPPSAPGGALLKTSFTESGSNVAVRVGIFPGIPNLEIGGNFTAGTLRDEPLLLTTDVDGDGLPDGLPAASRTLTGQYPADWRAVGVDLQYHNRWLSLRADWNQSTEELEGTNDAGVAPPFEEIDRTSWRVELAVLALKNLKTVIKDVWVTFRVDERDPDKDVDDSSDQRRYTIGVNLLPHSQVVFKLNYEIVEELEGTDLDNNGVLAQAVVYF